MVARPTLALLALLLAGCPLNTSSTMATSSSASASTPASSPSPSSSSSSAQAASSSDDSASSEPTTGIHGAIVRSQLETLNGMTPDQAKAQLKKFGHDGKVSLGEVTNSGGGHAFIESCGVNKVCGTSGGSGISVHDDITLYLNPTLTIAPPP